MATYYVGWPTDGDGDTLWFVDCTEEEAGRVKAWMFNDDRHEEDLVGHGWMGLVRPDSFEQFREESGMKDDEEADD